ncbi:MAG: DUF4349 domain-containing protein [Oscillospiraceae bacterium]|nr:DUF4349 domain-containing protein [Oscillospiraceae bacterium]
MMRKRVFLTALFLLLVLSLTACGSAAPTPAPTPAPASGGGEQAASAPSAPESAELDFTLRATMQDSAPAAESDYFRFPTLTPSQAGDRRLVYSVTMTLQTADFLPGMRILHNTVADTGGYIISAQIEGYDLRNPSPTRSATFRFRVPTEQLPEFIVVIENNFNIRALQQEMHERTAQYQENVWGLDELREQEAHLFMLLEEATEDARAALLDRLNEVRRSIRDLEIAQATITDSVTYSTIDIRLFEAVPGELSAGPGPMLFIIMAVLLTGVVGLVILVLVAQKRNSSSGATPS